MAINSAQPDIEALLKAHGVNLFGFSSLKRPLSFELYKQWIHEREHLDMDYLEKHLLAKERPELFRPARSAIVLAIPYLPHPWPSQDHPSWANSVALYARGKDYHDQIPESLEPLLRQLRQNFANESFEIFTDSAPILERDLAYRAGLGWIGKNTCLINREQGSLFFLAEIYTTLDLKNNSPWSPDFCGTCNRCVEACPTQALDGHYRLSPSRCISYWTIEAKANPPEALRPAFGTWLFGCDICQTVCPWNQKHLKAKVEVQHPSREKQMEELRWILSSSRKSLARQLRGTPLLRAASWKLQRNAILIASIQGFTELVEVINQFRDDPRLGELVPWSLKMMQRVSSQPKI